MTQQTIDDVDLWRDRTLVELAQAGDTDAFGELYGRYFRRLERFCVKRLGDPTEAEEAAQEAFTRAWRALPAFGGDRRFYPWMTVIASRICVDTVRRQARLEVGDVEDAPVVEPGYARLEAEGDVAALHIAMERVTSRHREVLELREHHGWSYQHIADHYQVSVGTVEALLWRARRALRREFLGVCSSIAALPVIRRWTIAGDAPSRGVVVALGSVSTVVVLAVGATAPGQPAAAAVGAVPTASVATVVWAIPALPVVPPAATPGTAVSTTAAQPLYRRTASVSVSPPPAPAPAAGSARPLATLLPRSQWLTPEAGAQGAREKPIVISTGPTGPVIGLDPGVTTPPVHIDLGGLP